VLEKKLAMLYSPLHSHQAVKHLPIEIPSKYQSCSFSPDSNQLAIIGDSGTHINIWELKTLQMIGKLFTSKVVRKVKFAPDGTLWVLFEDAGVRRYNLTNMTIEAEMQALHRGAVNDIDFDLNAYVLFSVGEDSLLKVWDYSFQREPHQVNIGHVGNINGVLYKDGRIWTIGSEGILQWNMKKDIPTYDPPFIRTRAANFIKNNIREERSVLPQLPSVEVEKSVQPISGQ
jgi:WD40 repeat protein